MPTTARGFRYPASSDPPNVPLDMQELATDVDTMFIQGTIASRPAAGKVGREHYATDTGQTSLDTGSSWVIKGFTDVVRTGDSRLSNARTPTAHTHPIADVTGLQAILDVIAPVGSVVDYAGTGDPANWALCDGRALNRVGVHAGLFAAIGTTYGAGNGSTTFNIPDFRGRVAVGPDSMGTGTGDAGRIPSPDTRGGVGGQHEVGLTSLQSGVNSNGSVGGIQGGSNVRGHSEVAQALVVNGQGAGYADGIRTDGGGLSIDFVNDLVSDHDDHTHSLVGRSADQAHPNMQPYQVINKIIRVA